MHRNSIFQPNKIIQMTFLLQNVASHLLIRLFPHMRNTFKTNTNNYGKIGVEALPTYFRIIFVGKTDDTFPFSQESLKYFVL